MKSCHRLEPRSALFSPRSDSVSLWNRDDSTWHLRCSLPVPWDPSYLSRGWLWALAVWQPWCWAPAQAIKNQASYRGKKKEKQLQLKVSICRVSLRLPLGFEVRVRAWDSLRQKRQEACYTLERCSFYRLPRSKFSRIKAQCRSVTELRMPRIYKEMRKRETWLDFVNSL